MSERDLVHFIEIIEKLAKKCGVLDVLFIGSFCRGRMSSTSDLDIRIYHEDYLVASFKAYLMASALRFYGLYFRFPIDVFCFSNINFLKKINKDETPCNLLENPKFLAEYPSSLHYKLQLDMLELL